MNFRNKKRLDKSAVAKKSENEREVIAVVHLAGDLSGIYSSLHGEKIHLHIRTYIHTLTEISRRPSTATRNFVHEHPKD